MLTRVLCGDIEVANKFSRDFFDECWAEVWSIVCGLRCRPEAEWGQPDLPEARSEVERAAAAVFYEGPKAIIDVEDLPLIFRVHVACILRVPRSDLIRQFIDVYLLPASLVGQALAYAAFTPGSVEMIGYILGTLPVADVPAVGRLLERLQVSLDEIADAVTERLLGMERDDFPEEELADREIGQRRQLALQWANLAGERADKLREEIAFRLVRRFVLDSDFVSAARVFRENRAAFPEKEGICWRVLFDAEDAYAMWKSNPSPELLELAEEKLKYVLLFRTGWMHECDRVDDAIRRRCFPLVAEQLVDVRIALGRPEEALAVSACFADVGKRLDRHFDPASLKEFLITRLKPIAITMIADPV
jgi:hypothetical protein